MDTKRGFELKGEVKIHNTRDDFVTIQWGDGHNKETKIWIDVGPCGTLLSVDELRELIQREVNRKMEGAIAPKGD